jgi:hypothetical protein
MRRRRVVIGLGVLLVVAAAAAVFWPHSTRPHRVDRRFDENKWLFATIHRADRVTLYEGLPRSFGERDLLEEEQRTKPWIDVHGFPFYTPPLDLTAPDRTRLTEWLGTEASFRPLADMVKACGGFHPDFAVEWAVGAQVYQCLICFGCGEVQVFGPGGELHCDMVSTTDPIAPAPLKRLLVPYQKNRPTSSVWPPRLPGPADEPKRAGQ